MRLGLNTFLLSPGFSTNDLPLLKTIRNFGADVVELAIVKPSDMDISQTREALSAAELANPVICGAFGAGQDLRGSPEEVENSKSYIIELIDIAEALGSKVVCGPMYSSAGRAGLRSDSEREVELDQIAASLKDLAGYASDRGISLAFEPLNRFETDCINTVDQGLDLIERVDHSALGLHLDTFHMHIEEANSADAIRQSKEKLFHIHFSASHRGIIGQDQVHWSSIVQALYEIGYDETICIESFSPDVKVIAKAASIWRDLYTSPEEMACKSLGFIRETWRSAQLIST